MDTDSLAILGIIFSVVGICSSLIGGNYIAAFWALASCGWATLSWHLAYQRRMREGH